LRVNKTRSAFDTLTRTTLAPKALGLPALIQVARSPEDEILLTELTFDNKDITTYEISSLILVAEETHSKGKFRCFMAESTKEFFIEIPDEATMKAFNQSTLINVLELASRAGAETMYVCVRKTIHRQQNYLKSFMFVGFEKLDAKEQATISMTKTHTILKCSLNGDEENDD